jgi:hypothetical protein
MEWFAKRCLHPDSANLEPWFQRAHRINAETPSLLDTVSFNIA